MNKSFIAIVLASVCLAACGDGQKGAETTKPDVLRAHMDTTIDPGTDFFEYANGGWLKNNPIPADEVSYGIGHLVDKELRVRLFEINDNAVKQQAKTGTGQLIGDFWYSAMDTVTIEREGLNAIAPELSAIAGLTTVDAVMQQAMKLHRIGVDVFFAEGVGQDAKNSDVQAFHLMQGGLGLPNRDYYFNTNPRTTKILAEYPSFLATMFRLMGADSVLAAKKAAGVVQFETKLAKASRKLEDLRDPYKNYNKYAITGLKAIAPKTEWAKYLGILGVHSVDSVIVGQPEFFTALDNAMNSTGVDVLRDYMAVHMVINYAQYLSKPFVTADFNFYSKGIRGAQEMQDKRRRALDEEQGLIGEALGQLFVKEYFDAKTKARYEQIVENVRVAFKARIERLDWMTDSTKQKAINKLMVLRKKVGYPDKWRDYSTLKVDRGVYARNIMRASEWRTQYSLNKLGKPVDRDEWDMTPQTYNAYYNGSNNEIVLPAAMMMVPGYKDEELDDAVVYGYMAASTVGHEITHGFDDEGRQYDEKGNLRSWWSDADTAQFIKRANVLVEQFNKMVPVDTIHINGKATLGENLADLGGILIGLDAFKLTEAYKKGEKIAGLTQLQRFFLGYSLGWMMALRPEVVADHLLTDVHSPAKYRVNGPFPNVPEFYEAFNVKQGAKLYLPDSARVKLW